MSLGGAPIVLGDGKLQRTLARLPQNCPLVLTQLCDLSAHGQALHSDDCVDPDPSISGEAYAEGTLFIGSQTIQHYMGMVTLLLDPEENPLVRRHLGQHDRGESHRLAV